QGLEYRLYDMRVRLATQLDDYDGYEGMIVLVRIDDRSLGEYGRFSQWPREYHSELAKKLADWGAAAIFFDVVFFQEDVDPMVDRRVSEGFSDAGVVYSAISLIDSSSYVFMSTVDEDEIIDNNPRSVIPVDRIKGADQLPDLSARRRQILEGPIPRITRASMGLGLVNAFPDEDGVVRRQSLLTRNGDYVMPTASLRLFLDLVGINFDEIEVIPGEALRIGNVDIPIDSQGRYLMRWYPTDAPPYMEISYYDVLEPNRVPGEFFAGKVVMVGPTAAALGDIKPTPADPALAGVKIHSTLFSNMALGHSVTPMGETLGIILTVFLGAVVAFFAFRFRISIGALLSGALFIIWLVAAVYAMVKWTYWVELFRPAFGLVVGYTSAMVYRYMTEEKQKRVIKGAFQQYVSPAVVDEMLDDPDKLQLGGERRELTILFADIQGFTGFSEKLEPEELTNFLNKFLTVMTNRIFEFQGTVDKYIGDAIMAIFGAPLPFDDHAVKALDAALGMHDELDRVRDEWGDFLPEKFDLKLGLNTGPVVVGNMGSDVRFDYTVLGDNVNLAARLEALTRQYGVSLLISESTREATGNQFLVRELDSVQVKGKEKPVVIFEVMARRGSQDDTGENQFLAEQFAEALRLYRAQKWDEALDMFTSLGDDPASQIFTERCSHLKSEPPGDDWDGVWIMTTK
ncbi:CHASE2 domain-containing protein, partial [Gemmatimonadota bacterium]